MKTIVSTDHGPHHWVFITDDTGSHAFGNETLTEEEARAILEARLADEEY